jgi:hypothetical protein
MRDRDIRAALREHLEDTFRGDADTLIIDELGLCQGSVRVDLAVVNGALHGYEIKSERDTLRRLPGQREVYDLVLDTVTVVVGQHHASSIRALVPDWWGVVLAASMSDGGVALETVRENRTNQNVDPHALVQLLWRDEALALLSRHGFQKGMKSKPRQALWDRLVEILPPGELSREVRQQLKARVGWKAGPRPV